jgi:hypothetical protein
MLMDAAHLLQTRYLVAPNYPVGVGATSSFRVELSIASSEVDWAPSSTIGIVPEFTFSNIVSTSSAPGTIAVSGMLGNREPVALKNVEVAVIFENASKIPFGATETVIDQISANGSVPFSVSYPMSEAITPDNTVVAAYALRP